MMLKREIARIMAEESVDFFSARKMAMGYNADCEERLGHQNCFDQSDFPLLRGRNTLVRNPTPMLPPATQSVVPRRFEGVRHPVNAHGGAGMGKSYSEVAATANRVTIKLTKNDKIIWNKLNLCLLASTNRSALLLEMEKVATSHEAVNNNMETTENNEAGECLIDLENGPESVKAKDHCTSLVSSINNG